MSYFSYKPQDTIPADIPLRTLDTWLTDMRDTLKLLEEKKRKGLRFQEMIDFDYMIKRAQLNIEKIEKAILDKPLYNHDPFFLQFPIQTAA